MKVSAFSAADPLSANVMSLQPPIVWQIYKTIHCKYADEDVNDRRWLNCGSCVNRVAVRLGEHDFNTDIDCETLDGEVSCADPVQDIEIEEVFPHKKFRHQYDDIALIRLSRPANMTPGNQFHDITAKRISLSF